MRIWLRTVWLTFRPYAEAILFWFTIMMLAGCVTPVSAPTVKRNQAQAIVPDALPVDAVINHVIVDSAAAEWFAKYRTRLDVEDTICLYGVVRADTATVLFMRATRTYNASPSLVYYDACPMPKRELFGDLLWLGGWHNHGPTFPGVDCNFSVMDDQSYYQQRAFVDLVSCSTGLIARGRKK